MTPDEIRRAWESITTVHLGLDPLEVKDLLDKVADSVAELIGSARVFHDTPEMMRNRDPGE